MLVLIAIGFVAGLITSISPCILPVLPVVLAAGVRRQPAEDLASSPTRVAALAPATTAARATAPAPATTRASAPAKYAITAPSKKKPGRRPRVKSWRPYAVVAGLVISFSAATLFGAVVLSALHLSDNLLRDAGIVVLVIFGLGLIFRPLGELLELPFVRLTGRPVNQSSNGLVLGIGAGLLFVPCAGPVLATIAVVGATHRVGFSAVVLTVAFGIGVAVPLLLLTLAGDALSRRTRALQRHAMTLRIGGGVLMLIIAAAIGFNLTDGLQRHVPGYTTALQNAVEGNKTASKQLQQLQTGGTGTPQVPARRRIDATELWPCAGADRNQCVAEHYRRQAATLAGLRGKVVLIDFWTYSCINCQRTLPHVEAWYARLPEGRLRRHRGTHSGVRLRARHEQHRFASECPRRRVPDRGRQRLRDLECVRKPVLAGRIPHRRHGRDPPRHLRRRRLRRYRVGDQATAGDRQPDADPGCSHRRRRHDTRQRHRPLRLILAMNTRRCTSPVRSRHRTRTRCTSSRARWQPNAFALSGTWNDGQQALTAGANAKLELNYQADVVYLVMSGSGTVTVAVNGATTSTIAVSGVPKLYTLVKGNSDVPGILTLSATPGVQAYDFTFG